MRWMGGAKLRWGLRDAVWGFGWIRRNSAAKNECERSAASFTSFVVSIMLFVGKG